MTITIAHKRQLKKAPAKAGIYMLKWPNGKYYVGKSKNIRTRFRQYINHGHHSAYGQRLSKKYGSPKMTVVALANNEHHLTELENHYINLFFEDRDNINFCRAKEYRKEEYGPSELKGRHKAEVWASNSWHYAPVSFCGWAPLKNLLGITYAGKIERREIVTALCREDLKQAFLHYQRQWINNPHHYNNGSGRKWFVFEGSVFATAKEAWLYSLLPIGLQYYQKHNYTSYYDYLHKSLGRNEVLVFDGLKFYGGLHAYLYAMAEIGISYHWFLVYYFKVGADTIDKIKMILNRPRNRGPGKIRDHFIKHKKHRPCVSSYLAVHDGKRWYCSIEEAKRHNAQNLKTHPNED